MLSHTLKRKASLLTKQGFTIEKFSIENETNIEKMVGFAKEYYYKHNVGAPIATMVTKGTRNDVYAFDEKHIRLIMDPLIKTPFGESFGVYKSSELKGFMMTRVTTVEEHFRVPIIPDYNDYFNIKNENNYKHNIYQERILTNKLFRAEIDSDSWISDNLKPDDKIMFMRVGVTHPSLKGTGITRQFWQEMLRTTAKRLNCVCILSEGTQEQSIYAVERMGFDLVKEVGYDDFSNAFKRRVVTRVKQHPRICLQVKWLNKNIELA